MYFFRIKSVAVMASFRIPESHTFQQTLPLPPVTTLTGIMGAALGINFEEAMKFRENKNIRFGVTGRHDGEVKDLWKYRKIKSSEVITDVLLKEYLTHFSMSFYISAESEDVIKHLRRSFVCPCYALTAGSSDNLLKIKEVSKIHKAEEVPVSDFCFTILDGDYSGSYAPPKNLSDLPVTETIRAPQVYLLPTAFKFKGEERRVVSRSHFTFVGSPITLEKPIPAIRMEQESVELL